MSLLLYILLKLKSWLQNKIIFTTVNVIEKPSQKQQKFNELVYKALEILIKENNEFKREKK